MKKSFIASMFVLATMPLLAADSSSAAGKWKIHNDIAGNESDQECTFAQNDKALTGSCKTENGEVKITGTVDGKKITWKYESEYNGTPLTMSYTGTCDDTGNMKGDVDVEPFGVSGEFTATPSKTDTGAQK
ncbi:MAG: hypothetical protein ACLPH3_03125 [Terracidiphilus sp.]